MTDAEQLNRSRFILDGAGVLMSLLRSELLLADELLFRMTDDQRRELAAAAALLVDLAEGRA